jgi:transcriptional regulator with XRE-family HTH domain
VLRLGKHIIGAEALATAGKGLFLFSGLSHPSGKDGHVYPKLTNGFPVTLFFPSVIFTASIMNSLSYNHSVVFKQGVFLMIDMKAFGRRLRLLREEKELNQIELSKVFSLANSTICQYEAGNRLPDAHTLEKLATYFNVSFGFLLCLTNTRHERTPSVDRQELSSGRVFDKDDEAHEADGHRMIGPELAYSTGLEAAAKAAGFEFDIEELEIDSIAPPDNVAAMLGLAPGEQALKRTQIQNIAGTPSRVITSWMPIDLFAGMADHQDKSLLEMLEITKGIYAVKVEERIRTSGMTNELANLFKTDPGACALEMQRVVYADIGRVLEVTFIAAAGMLWELAYVYAAGGRVSAPGWSWLPQSLEHFVQVQK